MINSNNDGAAGLSVEFTLTRSKRKTIAIYVSENGVEVRAPYHVSNKQASEFVAEKRVWIEKQLTSIATRPKAYQPDWRWGVQHYFLGEPHQLHCRAGPEVDFVLKGQQSDSAETVKRQILKWYRGKAEQVFGERHQFWVERLSHMGFPGSFIQLRSMKRRWGSCRSNGKITLNTNLVKYPLPCIDVVIVHELCHLREFNHSPRFYDLMSKALPDWKRHDTLLNQLSLEY